MTLAIVLLASGGFVISMYFTAVAYRWMQPDSKWVPPGCRMGGDTCAAIVFTPRARVFGLPNSVLGQIFYVALVGGVVGEVLFSKPVYYGYVAASLVTVVLGAYLSYSLLFLTRVPCKLCFTTHAINLLIFLLLLASA